jgi:sodium-dependent dicarboxylate transporter 2/3/5
MAKTGIDVYFFKFTMRLSGKVPKNILLGIMLTTMVASMILSNSATTSMVIASVMPLIRKLGKKLKKLSRNKISPLLHLIICGITRGGD